MNKLDPVKTAIYVQAFVRVENALIIAGSLLLFFFLPKPFIFWQGWWWLLFGFAGVITMFFVGINENQMQAEAINGMLEEKYNLDALKDEETHKIFQDLLNIQQEIEMFLQSRKNNDAITESIKNSLGQLAEWTDFAYKIACALDSYRRNPMLGQDVGAYQNEIEDLQRKARYSSNSSAKKAIDNLMTAKTNRYQVAQSLNEKMDSAWLQLQQAKESILTVYQQMSLVDTTRGLDDYNAETVRQDINEQVRKMNNLLSGLEKAYHDEE